VYPTLIASISDHVSPVARAPVVGVYRFWRDAGYVAGGAIAGVTADLIGFGGAIALVAGLTAVSGLWVALELDRGLAQVRLSAYPRVTRGFQGGEFQ
jgi:MFS family permease